MQISHSIPTSSPTQSEIKKRKEAPLLRHLQKNFTTQTQESRSRREAQKRSFGNGGAEDLGPEKAALGALDDLLVDGLRRVVHDDGAGLVVDLGVDACVADQVHDPFLAFVLAEAEAG